MNRRSLLSAPLVLIGAPSARAQHPENWTGVEGVYFCSRTGFGVGGMVTLDFRPLVLFRDFTFYEIEGPALEDMDLAASRRTTPERWGRWAHTTDGFTLIGARGTPVSVKLQRGNFFAGFPAEAGGNALSARYRRIAGGGNSAIGGDVTIATQTELTFTTDGRYARGTATGATSSGDRTGTGVTTTGRNAAAGRYRIERHTITLTGSGGPPQRMFFAFGSKGTPPQPDTAMIFLGDRVFTVRRESHRR